MSHLQPRWKRTLAAASPLPLLLCHGVNTNEEEMSPLLCPHLSLWPGDMHTHRCLSASASQPLFTLLPHTYRVIMSVLTQ